MGCSSCVQVGSRRASNAKGRVHGTANLYVAGSSVFPTGGWANPTLTIAALSLRTADRLADRLAAPDAVLQRA